MVESDSLGAERMGDDAPDYDYWTRPDTSAATMAAAERAVAILLLPQASAASALTIYEDLCALNHITKGERRPRVAPRLVKSGEGRHRSLSGADILSQAGLGDVHRYDAVVIPALFDDGALSKAGAPPVADEEEAAWLRRQHAEGAVFAAMCTGGYALAEAGLLDGLSCTTHPLFAAAFAARYPKVKVDTRRSLVVSGPRREFVSGGQSIYSADVSLYVIARFFGTALALRFAGLYGKPVAGALDSGEEGEDTQADLTVLLAKRFILQHLAAPSLVSAAAEMAHLGERTFCRRFTRAVGLTPRAFILEARMSQAKDLLSGTRLPIEEVAARVGYADRSSFAKLFKDRTGETPAGYRRRYQAPVRLGGMA